MGTEESDRFAPASAPQHKIPNTPLPPHWSTSMQVYHNSGSTPTTFLNPYAAGSYFYHCMWENQAYGTPLQYDSLHDPSRLSNYPTAAWDFPSTKRQQCDMMLGIGEDAQKVTSIGNHNAVHVNRNFASHHFATNSTELNQNLGTGLNASGTNAQLLKLEEDEIRKQRKRQSNRESARRSRIRKQQECEELYKTMDNLSAENSLLSKKLKSLSEDCEVLSNENDSIQEELVKMYGPESVADLLAMKPA